MPKPSRQEARNHLLETSVTLDGELLPLCSSPEIIGAATGGVGIQLYFLFLKYTGAGFALWALLQLPILIVYIQSSGGPDASGIELLTAFNVGIEDTEAISSDTDYHVPGFGTFRFGDIIPFIGMLDAAGLLCWIIIVGWFCYRTMPKIVERFDVANITPSDFSVEISGLPSRIDGHAKYEEKLRDHIVTIIQRARAEAGKDPIPDPDEIVYECCLVRDFKGRLLAFKNLEMLQIKLDNAKEKDSSPKVEAEIMKLEQKMEKLREKSKAPLMDPTERNVCKRAYVMLANCEAKETLLDYYRFANFRLFRWCQKGYMRFEGNCLHIVEAPEPGNIMWENQDRNDLKVFIQKFITLILAIIMFTVSFVIIFSAKIATKKLQEDLQSCVVRLVPATVDNFLTELPLDVCKCQEIGLAGVVSVPELKDNYCKAWFQDELMFKGLLGASAAIVVIVNLILQVAVNWFTRLEQPLSVSGFYASLAFKISIAQFFNTGIIVLLVNSKLFSFLDLIGDSGIDFFNRQWYQVVGVALVITLMVQTLSPHLVQVCTYPVLNLVRWIKGTSKKTQRDLNTLYTWPEFNLAVRLAGLFNVILCTMMYSAGLPVLSISATITFFTVYFSDKFLLLRASRMPPAYNQSLLMVFKRIVPFICFLHTCIAIFMLGEPKVFPGSALIPELDLSNPDNELSDLKGIFDIPLLGVFFSRCLSGASFGNFMLWLLILVFFALSIVRVILGATFGVFLQACLTFCCRREDDSKKDLAENKVTSRQMRQKSVDSRSATLFSYAPEGNPTYAGLIAQANAGSATRSDSTMDTRETSGTITIVSAGNINSPDDENDISANKQ